MASTEFLNIDLDLESRDDLSLIIQEFGDSVIIMNNENDGSVHKVSFELAGLEGNPDYLFNQYFSLIRKLSARAKSLWYGCLKREFDLGFETGSEPKGLQEKLSDTAIGELSNLKASVVITIYSLPAED